MTRTLRLNLLVLMLAAPASAQAPAVASRDFLCPDCALSGQTPGSGTFDASQVEFVANPIPAFDENQTFRQTVIARVLRASPLMLEVLDTHFQMLDRNQRVVREQTTEDPHSPACLSPEPLVPVDLASKPVISTLRLNDIVTADLIMNRSKDMPEAILAATPTLTNVRKVTGPVPLVPPATAGSACGNRSGRLVVHMGPEDGELTIVYNDGGIYHRNAAYLTFTREKLSAADLSDLLRAFSEVNFDSLPTTFPEKQSSNRPSITLIGARYQRVALKGGDARLAALVKRLDALADRAMSHSRYIVKSAPGVPLVVRPWVSPDVDLTQLADARLRNSTAAPAAWQQRVPDDILSGLPIDAPGVIERETDPNRLIYFSQAGRVYRVARPFYCVGARTCVFRDLSVAELAEPASGECAESTFNCQTIIYPDGRKVRKPSDPPLTSVSGLLWPRSMGVRLRDLPPAGLMISVEEYKAHKPIYFPILRFRMLGSNYIEDGILYQHVRVCQIDDGADPSCEITPTPGLGK